MGEPLNPALAFLLALLPAAIGLWIGRAFARHADDPLLAEQLLASRRRGTTTFAIVLALLIVGWPAELWWTLPLTLVGRVAGGYPLRRVLFGETWNLGSYLSFVLRLIFGVHGFRLLLLFTPMIVSASRERDVMVAAGLAILLTVWQLRSTEIVRFVLHTRPVDHAAVVARVTTMIEKSGVTMPYVEQVDLHGGVVANAIALPSLRRSAILMTDTVLDRLDTDEIVAIAGHEIAHLEFYNRRRLGWIVGTNVVMSAVAVVVPLVLVRVAPAVEPTWLLLWAVPLLIVLKWQVRHRQRDETDSDLRAIQLAGDADALIRALTKIHSIARYPRRWDPKFERAATHPSLARRIQAIRRAADSPASALAEAETFIAPDRKIAVTLRNDAFVWREREASGTAVPYGDLEELRIDAGSNAARLVAAGDGGRRWTMTLAPEDVARAQAVLDVVDIRIGRPSARRQTMWMVWRWAAIFLLLIAISVLVGILLHWPGPPILGLGWRQH